MPTDMSTFEELYKAPAVVRSLEPEATEQKVEKNKAPRFFAVLPRDIVHNPDLSNGAVRLYCLMMSYAWYRKDMPSKEALAQRCGVSVTTLNRYLDELVEAGKVTVKHRGVGLTNLYYFNEDEIWRGKRLGS